MNTSAVKKRDHVLADEVTRIAEEFEQDAYGSRLSVLRQLLTAHDWSQLERIYLVNSVRRRLHCGAGDQITTIFDELLWREVVEAQRASEAPEIEAFRVAKSVVQYSL